MVLWFVGWLCGANYWKCGVRFDMSKEKEAERREMQYLLSQFLNTGGKIQYIPFGTPANDRAEPGGHRVTKGTSRLKKWKRKSLAP